MNETLSTRQLRLVALLGLVVVAAGAYWLLVGRKTSSPSTASSTPVATTPASTTTTPAPTKPHAQTSTPTRIATHGLPLVVARALQKHAVVVVSLDSPGASVDQLVTAEAQAGARASRVGFVELNVFRQRQGAPILHKLGVVDTPAVLVVKRPNLVYAEFPGYVDRTVVEQAVADARG
jgi:hypothetical protein